MEKTFFVLFLLIVTALCIGCVIPRKDGTVSRGAGTGSIIHVKKQKFRYARWVILNLLNIVLLATVLWLELHEETAADTPGAANLIATILFSLLCNFFLNALCGVSFLCLPYKIC